MHVTFSLDVLLDRSIVYVVAVMHMICIEAILF